MSMNRRDFLKGTCGICVALSSGLLMASVIESCKTPIGVVKTSAKNNIVNVPVASFDKNGFQIVRVSNFDYDLAVQRKADGTYETLVLMCTHAGQPLTKTGDNYYCTLHGSQFDHEGHVTKGPADQNLERLPTSIYNNNISIKLKQTS